MVVAKETASQVGRPSADLAGEIGLGLAGSLNPHRTVLSPADVDPSAGRRQRTGTSRQLHRARAWGEVLGLG